MRRILFVVVAVALVGLGVPAYAGDSDVVTVLGFEDASTDAGEALVEELSTFAAKKGFSVAYESYSNPADLFDQIEGTDPPDVIIVPLPWMLHELDDSLTDLSGFVKAKKLRDVFGDYLIDLATTPEGMVLGAPIKADLKSLVWYQPAAFTSAGYEVPETFAELIALSDAMVADGEVPWCNYIESGFATGWLGTDWIEDLLLGAEGPDVYDQWVDHTVIFQDPRVEDAFDRYQQMIDTPGYVFDRASMTSVPFWANAGPLGSGDCLMHRQADFFASAIADFGFDLDDFAVFKFPSVSTEFGDAAFGGASYVAALDDRKAVEQLTGFMLGKKFGETALAQTGWLLPNTDFNTTHYPDDLVRSWAAITSSAILAEEFRFDGSDLMPPEVGAGTFWTGVVDLVNGTKTVPQILADIDASWP